MRARSGSANANAAQADAPDQRIGRYAIYGDIATGGMATVHFGRLLGQAGFSRDVAIKRLHPQYAKNPDFVAMFLDEARLVSRILHPNVVPVLDVVAESGELFLVMELVPGEALSKLVRNTPEGVPLPIAVAIAVGMLEGLHAAHEARGEDKQPLDIVHRDVSPQNVLVGTDGVARLIDFGVAKAVGNSVMTRDGQIKGKVAYMAPEQIAALPVDRRADIYSAAVVLWEMVTGRRYFGEGIESDAALVMRAMNHEPAPPSSVRKEIPAELDAIILKGLSKTPANRFATAREMAQALEKIAAPAAARDVARWMEAKAGEALRRRAHQMSAFDLSIATELPGRSSMLAAAKIIPRTDSKLAFLARPAPEQDVGSGVETSPAIAAARASKPQDLAAIAQPAASPASPPQGAALEPVSAVEPESAAPRATVALVDEASRHEFVLPQAAGSRSRRSAGWIALALVLASGVGFVTARMLDRSERPLVAARPSYGERGPAVATSLAPGAAAPTATTAQGSGGASASAAASASVSAPRPALTNTSSNKAPQPARTTTATTTAAARPGSCDPPYTMTADGVKRFKPECLR
ncbi:MAG: serine/threonine-protein kinase [Polyangiaceae bacterium]